MSEITCISCGKPLTDDFNTYGDYDAPMCWACWSEAMALDVPAEDMPNTEITAAIWAADAERGVNE